MALFAGILARTDDTGRDAIPRASAKALAAALVRGGDPARTFEAPGFFLAQRDVGAFGEPGLLVTHAAATAVAGDPLPEPAPGGPPSRLSDLERLAPAMTTSGATALRSCRGSFALCHYDRDASVLTLATDRLGVRPLYFYAGQDFLVFSTALRVLEVSNLVPRRMDLRAVAEETVLGFALGDRTPYTDIKVLQSAEALRCHGREARRSAYYRWEDIQESTRPTDELLDEAYGRFLAAVGRRAASDRTAISFLSGGLDSRCIVSTLKVLGRDVATVAFDLPGSPDRPIADAVAARLGTRHYVRPCVPSLSAHEQTAYRPGEPVTPLAPAAASPQRVFSGDGGSVGLGCVYMDRTIVGHMRDGQVRLAAEAYLSGRGLVPKLFRPGAYRRLAPAVLRGVVEELEPIAAAADDPARAFYFFLLKNDQRRHLHRTVYEDIDLRRVEYLLPFFDCEFLELVASVPIDQLLYHGFYHRWLSRFPAESVAVPWQTYPGHLPCPIGGPTSGSTQWEVSRTRRFRSQAARRMLPACWEALTRSSFPDRLLRRPVVWLAYLLQQSGLSSQGHNISMFLRFSEYYNRCGGAMEFPDESTPDPVRPLSGMEGGQRTEGRLAGGPRGPSLR